MMFDHMKKCFTWCTWNKLGRRCHDASASSPQSSSDDALPTPWPILQQSFLRSGESLVGTLEVGSPPDDFSCKSFVGVPVKAVRALTEDTKHDGPVDAGAI